MSSQSIITRIEEATLPPARAITLEAPYDEETIRRYTTVEVRWDDSIGQLTIDEVHLDRCHDMAARVMEVLPFDRFELESADDDAIRYRVFGSDWKLRRAIFHVRSLRRLASDPNRAIKIEYLRRDLIWSTTGRKSFVYPNALRNTLGG